MSYFDIIAHFSTALSDYISGCVISFPHVCIYLLICILIYLSVYLGSFWLHTDERNTTLK